MEADFDVVDMEINRENIGSKEFNLEKKGYNKEEVKLFLTQLVDEIESVSLKNSYLENEVNELNSKIEEYLKIEKELRDAVLFFKESEKEALLRVEEKASKIIKQAEEKSVEIIINAENEAKSTRDTLIFLKEQGEIFIARLKIIIDSQEGMLNDLRAGSNSDALQKTMAEAAAFKANSELKIDAILEKLL